MTAKKENSGWRWVLVLASLFGVFALLYVLDATFTGYSWSDVGQHLAFMAVFLLIASAIVWLRGRRRR
ncbi:hypothetical protein ACGFY7_06400 [Streptomyces prunicolor]|uniref:hypothetical protein n=1 Tax=Streptomyces prunicolor TaxID=67348 RepID=UPI0037245C6C|nr:hypothetical protein OG588_27820 [Streptomyces prunicolor]